MAQQTIQDEIDRLERLLAVALRKEEQILTSGVVSDTVGGVSRQYRALEKCREDILMYRADVCRLRDINDGIMVDPNRRQVIFRDGPGVRVQSNGGPAQ